VEHAEELEERLAAESDNGIKIKLIFLNAFGNHNLSYEAACSLCGIHTSTGYVWVRRWNKSGYDGLKRAPTRAAGQLSLLKMISSSWKRSEGERILDC
jgi:transposase